ncbi:MAG: EF-P beta-lysylation protein EpmB [Planctomycetaceae bacterium]|nr:EF-P beta-lysylation protein EpmB [Planctomycetaceae bacterium]
MADDGAQVRWQREMAGAVRSRGELLRRLKIHSLESETAVDADNRFPVLVPVSYLKRMKPGHLSDPLLLQVLPTIEESADVLGFVPDAVGDLASRRTPGLIQKYFGRALLITTGACAVHCRYCFRRDYPYAAEPKSLDEWKPALEALSTDATISEVILSGGDPLMLTDQRLNRLCRLIDAIPHIERIRIHTRLPIVLPSRVTPELLGMSDQLRSQLIFVVHANHPAEIVEDCAAALSQLSRKGFPVLNQAVLMKGVNDDPDVLELLCRRLINLGVIPYYLHQLDRVAGAAHFEVEPETGRALIEHLRARLPGYAVPQFVVEIAGRSSKTPL